MSKRARKPSQINRRCFFDMDGTLATFAPVKNLEELYKPGYFLSLTPMLNVVQAVKYIIKSNAQIEVFILSSVLSDSIYALKEKNAWLDQYLPEIDQNHRLFPACGENKRLYVCQHAGSVTKRDILIDDYTQNLLMWEPQGTGIKVLNGINHTKGTWKGITFSSEWMAEVIGQGICRVAETASPLRIAPRIPMPPEV